MYCLVTFSRVIITARQCSRACRQLCPSYLGSAGNGGKPNGRGVDDDDVLVDADDGLGVDGPEVVDVGDNGLVVVTWLGADVVVGVVG